MSKRNNRKHPVKISILQGDVFETVSKLNANFFEACLNDGPYGLTDIGKRVGKKGFLDQTWDGALPSAEVWQEILRVCKPGSGMLSFGHPRTYHRLACNIEDAGWELRDCLMWLYGQGMPKSHDIGKAIDRLNPRHPGNNKPDRRPWGTNAARAAQLWRGYGFGLKPGYEPVVLSMKPCEESFAKNALKWGVAGLNIDGCRIGPGRFPANVILWTKRPVTAALIHAIPIGIVAFFVGFVATHGPALPSSVCFAAWLCRLTATATHAGSCRSAIHQAMPRSP
jgi:hypothetical protein